MASYDRNGLELTPVSDSLNSYKFTAVDRKNKYFVSYAQATQYTKQIQSNKYAEKIYSMIYIGYHKDPRDAAYVGQVFNELYTEEQIYNMAVDGEFRQIAKDFVNNIEIPKWKHPAEGLTMDDIVGNNSYKKNRVVDAREALVEAIEQFGVKVPSLAEVKNMIAHVEELYNNGYSYRNAAKTVLNIT